MGESFGGPLALRMASRDPELVIRVVLVASFVTPPLPRLRVAAALARRAPVPPAIALRAAMLGADADASLVGDVRAAIAATPRETIAARLASLAALDARSEALALPRPLTALVATRDRLVVEARAAEPGRLAPHGEVVPIDGPHLLAQARARQFAALVAQYMVPNP